MTLVLNTITSTSLWVGITGLEHIKRCRSGPRNITFR